MKRRSFLQHSIISSAGFQIHPGWDTPAQNEQFSSYFEGNLTSLQWFNRSLDHKSIVNLFEMGLPNPINTFPICFKQKSEDDLKVLFLQNGNYTFKSEKDTKEVKISNASEKCIEGSWKVEFEKNRGVEDPIILPELISLHKHEKFDVKHFSGTATYIKQIHLSKKDLNSDQHLFLDLGRVEVLAEVIFNGVFLKNVWKEPYIVELGNNIKKGSNELIIKVTNLWPNRLIGDEHLPIENKYSEHKFIEKLPEWYIENKPKPGKRITFSTWKHFGKDDPLLESGLLGPVRILSAEVIHIKKINRV